MNLRILTLLVVEHDTTKKDKNVGVTERHGELWLLLNPGLPKFIPLALRCFAT